MFDVVMIAAAEALADLAIRGHDFTVSAYSRTPDQLRRKWGFAAELTVRDLLGLSVDVDLVKREYDYDLIYAGKTFDVKTVVRTVPPGPKFVNNLSAHQADRKVYGYIFCSFNTTSKILTICGWLPQTEVKKRGEYIVAGTERPRADGSKLTASADFYEILNSQLFSADSAEELRTELQNKGGKP